MSWLFGAIWRINVPLKKNNFQIGRNFDKIDTVSPWNLQSKYLYQDKHFFFSKIITDYIWLI